MKIYSVTVTNDFIVLPILVLKTYRDIHFVTHFQEIVLIPNVKIQYELVTNIQFSITYTTPDLQAGVTWSLNSTSQRDLVKEVK